MARPCCQGSPGLRLLSCECGGERGPDATGRQEGNLVTSQPHTKGKEEVFEVHRFLSTKEPWHRWRFSTGHRKAHSFGIQKNEAQKKKKKRREKSWELRGCWCGRTNSKHYAFFLLICKQDRHDLWTIGKWHPRVLSQRRYLRNYLERSDEGQTNSRCREDNKKNDRTEREGRGKKKKRSSFADLALSGGF